ncbi:MAG TPA: hypothetical protein VI298_10985 [Geobacteraceae bacterium]
MKRVLLVIGMLLTYGCGGGGGESDQSAGITYGAHITQMSLNGVGSAKQMHIAQKYLYSALSTYPTVAYPATDPTTNIQTYNTPTISDSGMTVLNVSATVKNDSLKTNSTGTTSVSMSPMIIALWYAADMGCDPNINDCGAIVLWCGGLGRDLEPDETLPLSLSFATGGGGIVTWPTGTQQMHLWLYKTNDPNINQDSCQGPTGVFNDAYVFDGCADTSPNDCYLKAILKYVAANPALVEGVNNFTLQN